MFIAMLMMRMLKENKKTAKVSWVMVVDKAIAKRPKQKKTKPTSNGYRLSNLATSQPEKGKLTKELIGKTKSKLPSSASLKEKVSLMVGIREAQEEKQAPERKKESPNATLIL